MIRTLYSGIGKTAIIYPAAFLQNFGLLTLILGAIFYVREVHGVSKAMLGIFCALFTVGYGVGCVAVRPLTDHIRPRYLLIASAVSCSGLSLLLLGQSFLIAAVCYALIGLLGCLFWPPMMGWLAAELESAALGKTMSRYNISMSIASIAGAPFAAWLSHKDPALPILVAGGIMFINAAMMTCATVALPIIRNDTHTASAPVTQQSNTDNQYETRLRYAGWIGLFTAFTASGIVGNIFPIAAKEDLLIAKPVIGLLLMFTSISATAMFFILGRTSFWHYRSWPMLAGQTCLAMTMIVLIRARQPWAIAPLMLIIGCASSLSHLNSLFHGLAGSANRAARSAVHEAVFCAGLVFGVLGSGFLYENYSMSTAYQACAVIITVGIICQAAVAIWSKRTEVRVRPL